MMSSPPSSPPASGPGAGTRPVGRPRDQRIDDAVLAATADLLQEVGYTRLSIAAVAARAGTHKPAVYRRWPTKAQLVHEAAFPDEGQRVIPDTGDLRADLTSIVRGAIELFSRPVVRAAVPGLLAEFAADPDLHVQLLERLSDQVWGAIDERFAAATDRGELRLGVDPSIVLELVGGSALLALLTRSPEALDDGWIESTVSVLMEGIAP
jgi:AcrR family transcriptional regulator